MRLLLAARVFALSALAIGCDEQVYIQVNPPMIAVNTDALDFGEIPLDATVDRSLSILNAGGETLAVGRLYVHGAAADAFSLEAPRLSVPPGKEREVRVRFAPRVLGDASATLEIPSNAHNAPEESVALLGRGVEASVCGPCDDPPDPRCLTELNRVRYDPNGLCVDDQCRYQAVVEACAERCDPDNAACVGGVLDAGQRDGTAPADAGSDSAQLPDAGEALCEQAACNPPGPHFHLADTNQRTCYDENSEIACPGTPGDAACGATAFCGQDAQVGWDSLHAAEERFVRQASAPAEPVVIDQVTGLMWQGCPHGQSGASCAGTAIALPQAEALVLCDGLTWGGHDDWRLPDELELESIVDLGRVDPAIDPTTFPATPPAGFATSSAPGWRVLFVDGSVDRHSSGDLLVRCVRRQFTTVSLPERRFTISEPRPGQPVVVDALTRLQWHGCAAGLSGVGCAGGAVLGPVWQDALAYCEFSDWAGVGDWRLPDLKELRTVVDNAAGDEEPIDAAVFPATPPGWYWTSTTDATPGHTLAAWCVGLGGSLGNGGSSLSRPKSAGGGVRCVRGGR